MSNVHHDIALLRAMDEGAWATLQDEFYRRVYFYVKRYVVDHQTTEDITQDVFLGAVRGIATFDKAYTLDQFLFGIAKNRVIDHYRKHKTALVSPQKDDDRDASMLWLDNMPNEQGREPAEGAVERENTGRRRVVLGRILKEFVGELWEEGEFTKLKVLEYLFVLQGRNKDAAARFGISDEKAVAGIKFRAVEKLRGLARQNDPNHSLFLGLWEPGSR
jgi:RNA polymerase sigma-70 factor (ECF subfamily)